SPVLAARGYKVAGNELIRTRTRELSPHANAHKVRVLAIVFNPLGDLLFVRAFDIAGVYLEGFPAMREFPKTLPEPARILRRVAEGQPNDFCIFIGESAFRYFPDFVIDRAGFVEDQQDALALIVQASKRVCIVR